MKKRELTNKERSLWRDVTQDVTPLIPDGFEDQSGKPARDDPAEPKSLKDAKPYRTAQFSQSHGLEKPPARAPDLFSSGDPRFDRHARRGRMPIDATLDLHGHTQQSAHRALFGFLLDAHSRSLRCVLVITGKGEGAASQKAGDFTQRRGVLRARFFDWLKEDRFRQLVARVSPAGPRHGGGGAFYVFLKVRSHRN